MTDRRTDGRTDGRTDRILIARPRLHFMQRGKNGVGIRLMQDSPALVQIHCIAHRLNLACIDAMKDVPFLQSLKQHFNALYLYFSASPARTDKLKSLQSVLDEPTLKLKHAIDVRWLMTLSLLSIRPIVL